MAITLNLTDGGRRWPDARMPGWNNLQLTVYAIQKTFIAVLFFCTSSSRAIIYHELPKNASDLLHIVNLVLR